MSKPNKFNEKLARKALAQIEGDPKSWNQGDWRCETGMCFAGWVVTLDKNSIWANGPSDVNAEHVFVVKNGQVVGEMAAAERASQLLGFNDDGDNVLYEGGNTFEQLQEYVEEYASGERNLNGYLEI